MFNIFDKDIDILKRFIDCPLVKKFNSEQQLLNKYIVQKFSADDQWHKDMAVAELEIGKSFNKSQKIVWLFQHAETIMMDIVRDELKKLNITVLANVHDAIVTRQRLTLSQLADIEQTVRSKTMVEYFALGETKY